MAKGLYCKMFARGSAGGAGGIGAGRGCSEGAQSAGKRGQKSGWTRGSGCAADGLCTLKGCGRSMSHFGTHARIAGSGSLWFGYLLLFRLCYNR